MFLNYIAMQINLVTADFYSSIIEKYGFKGAIFIVFVFLIISLLKSNWISSLFSKLTDKFVEKFMRNKVKDHHIKSITDLARSYGALVVWDARHAAGAIEMNFDDNGVDLAVGCTYKYGNAGPGSPAWLYVNKKIQSELQTPIQGWFANEDQFGMGADFVKAEGIRGFQIASPSIIGIRGVQVSYSMIEEAGINVIASKAAIGTQMMIDLFDEWLAPLGYTLLTSRNPQERGGHISLGHPDAARICVALRKFANVIPDYRTPNAIRLAISPLATSYVEVWDGFQRITALTETRQYEKIEGSESRVT